MLTREKQTLKAANKLLMELIWKRLFKNNFQKILYSTYQNWQI